MRRLVVTSVALMVIGALIAGCGGGSGSSKGAGADKSGKTNVVLWYGWSGAEADGLKSLVSDFNRTSKSVHVTAQFIGSNKVALPKVLTGIRGGDYPDVVYMWGSLAPQIAELPQSVKLNDRVAKDSSMQWNDFWEGERQAATANGKIVGVPALVDNLAVVYNKKLLRKAGLKAPSPDWTWDDFTRYAKAMTDKSGGHFGAAFPADGTENTVWRYVGMLWEAGGSMLSPDMKKAAFDSPAGVKALQSLQQLVADKSVYVDTTGSQSEKLFNSGKVGLFVTGPWDLPQFESTDYGVQIMPAYPGVGDHQTISGPDLWVMLNNGDKRVNATYEFVKWLTAPAQIKTFSLATGDLPTRASVADDAAFAKKFSAQRAGVETFVENLKNVKQSRPATPAYSKVSEALGEAIDSVLLGKQTPQKALSSAADKVNGILAQG